MTRTVPEKLGKYEVKDEIARGSMGVVYLGYDPFIDRPVALKVALAESLQDKESGERRRPHHIDLKSGKYRGRQILEPKSDV